MMFKFQPNGLVVLRATLIIKSVAVLAMLLVALLLQDRHGQAVMLWPVVVVLLLLVVFGTNWFETRLGVYFFPLALATAIALQTLELALRRPVIASNPVTSFSPIEPFLFLLVPVALAAWRYHARGAILAAGGASLLYAVVALIVGGTVQLDLITLVTHWLILMIIAGGAALLAAQVQTPDPATHPAELGTAPDHTLSRETRDRLITLLSGLDSQIDTLYDEFDDRPDSVRYELIQLKLATADALAMLSAPRRSMPLCARSLMDALYEYVDLFRQRTGVAVALQLKLEPDSLQPEQAETAFKIVEEALDGVACHACAEASISLLSSASHVALSVHGASPTATLDDGAALSSEARLLSLHRRAEAVGGILCVSQQPQRGTTVACVFPRSTTHA